MMILRFDIPANTNISQIIPEDISTLINRNYLACFNKEITAYSEDYIIYVLLEENEVISSVSLSESLLKGKVSNAIPPYLQGLISHYNLYFLFNITTYPPFQRRGHMKGLLRYVMDQCIKPCLLYLIVDDNNLPAINLYLNLEFKIADEYRYTKLMVLELK